MPIPDDTDEGVKRGRKRALESEAESAKKKKPGTITKEPTFVSHSQVPRPDCSILEPAPSKGSKPTLAPTSIKLPGGKKERLALESSKTSLTDKGPMEKLARAAAVDFFDTSNPEDRPPLSKPSARKTTVLRRSTESKPSPDTEHPAPNKPQPQGEKPPGTKTILKPPKRIPESSTAEVPAKEKHVKFAVKVSSNLKTKRDKTLGSTKKKVRSGGGNGASAKDRVLKK